MLEREDGERWVVRYGVDAFWRSFADARVVVEGERYEPEGQALVNVHFRVGRFRGAEKGRDGRPVDYAEISEERTLRGRFQDAAGAPGTKSEGERFLTFVEDGGRAWRVHGAPASAPRGEPVTVRARVVDVIQLVSVAGVTGPQLWIVGP